MLVRGAAGASDQGKDIAGLYQLMFWIAIGVGAIVLGLILYSVLRFRRRNEDLPKQTRYHLPLEVTYTVIPIRSCCSCSPHYRVEHASTTSRRTPACVDATAFQWQWRFTYPQYRITIIGSPTTYPTFEVPVGETVRIQLRAQDVIHAFYVPQFLFKRDAIPGKLNVFDFRVPKAGTLPGSARSSAG